MLIIVRQDTTGVTINTAAAAVGQQLLSLKWSEQFERKTKKKTLKFYWEN